MCLYAAQWVYLWKSVTSNECLKMLRKLNVVMRYLTQESMNVCYQKFLEKRDSATNV